MEEERRLAYVAVTRAKDALFILHTKSRLLFGKTECFPVSRFVSEIPEELLEKEGGMSAHATQIPRPNMGTGGYGGRTAGTATGGYGNRTANSGNAGGYGAYGARNQARERPHDSVTVAQPIFKRREAASEGTFAAGDRVKHAVFGAGEILSVRPMGSDILYEVIFDKVGVKKMMATYAKLKKED